MSTTPTSDRPDPAAESGIPGYDRPSDPVPGDAGAPSPTGTGTSAGGTADRADEVSGSAGGEVSSGPSSFDDAETSVGGADAVPDSHG